MHGAMLQDKNLEMLSEEDFGLYISGRGEDSIIKNNDTLTPGDEETFEDENSLIDINQHFEIHDKEKMTNLIMSLRGVK